MTPEELDTRLEDAALLADSRALAELHDARAVAVGPGWVGGPARALDVLADHVSGRVHLLGDVAVSVSDAAVVVSARGPDRRWRVVVSVARQHNAQALALSAPTSG